MTSEAPEKRTVRVRFTVSFELDREVPADWSDEEVGFFFEGSSHCVDNEVRDYLERSEAEGACQTCSNCSAVIVAPKPTP